MTTPLLSTYVRNQTERRERQMQTALPAKVTAWSSSTNTVELEPQFVETWTNRDDTRESEVGEPIIRNVPVCYPWHMTWDITVGAFGLIICTKYSLDQWRQQLRRMDPGDLRRFTMSGATFHPVVIGESPNATQQFVALENLVKTALDKLQNAFDFHVHATAALGTPSVPIVVTPPPPSPPTIPLSADLGWDTDVGSTTVKVSE